MTNSTPTRLRRYAWPEETRQRIAAGKIVSFLQEHVAGKREMSSTQIRAAEILLRKVLPDLTAVALAKSNDTRSIAELSNAELLALAGPERTGETIEGVVEPVGVH